MLILTILLFCLAASLLVFYALRSKSSVRAGFRFLGIAFFIEANDRAGKEMDLLSNFRSEQKN